MAPGPKSLFRNGAPLAHQVGVLCKASKESWLLEGSCEGASPSGFLSHSRLLAEGLVLPCPSCLAAPVCFGSPTALQGGWISPGDVHPNTGRCPVLIHPRGQLSLLISPGLGTLWAPGSCPSGWAPGPPACLSQKPPLPLPEFLEDNPVWEALAADADALQDPVAPQLLQHQVGVQLPCLEERKEGVTLPD